MAARGLPVSIAGVAQAAEQLIDIQVAGQANPLKPRTNHSPSTGTRHSRMRAGMTVRAFNAIARRYYEGVGLWNQPGWALGYELGCRGLTTPYPERDRLFVEKEVYDYRLLDETSVCAFYAGRYREGKQMCLALLAGGGLLRDIPMPVGVTSASSSSS